MIFRGKYLQGVFVVSKGQQTNYNLFISKIQENNIEVQIDIKRLQKHSENQVDLLHAVIYHISDKTGHTYNEVLRALEPLRKRKEGLPISFNQYDTIELTSFIEKSIMFLNTFFELDISITQENGKTRIK